MEQPYGEACGVSGSEPVVGQWRNIGTLRIGEVWAVTFTDFSEVPNLAHKVKLSKEILT